MSRPLILIALFTTGLLAAPMMIGCRWGETKEPPLAGQPEGPFRPRPRPPVPVPPQPPLPQPEPEPAGPDERVGWIERIVDRRLDRKLEEALNDPELVKGGDPNLVVGGWVSSLVAFVWKIVKAVLIGAIADVAYSWWYIVVPTFVAVVSLIAWPAGWAGAKFAMRGK